MKRFLCILLCLLLVAPAATAEDYTPRKLFRQQFITGGNGLRGTVSVSVSGVAEWVDLLMPFAGTMLQVRMIGEPQGAASAWVTDDDDWQMKLWAKDDADGQHGLTYVYGNPDGIMISSELLPDELLSLPVKGVNLPYMVSDGEVAKLFNAFNPLQLPGTAESGNVTAWSALGELFAIDDGTWDAQWAPVLAKYETLMDMWLADYAAPTVVTETDGRTMLRTSYDIPAEALKAQMKYVLGLMMSDAELLMLITPHLTDDQRSLYLNPAMLWFYEHCIDIAPLHGNIMLERETTMLGETTAMGVSLPLLPLPGELTAPLGSLLKELFALNCDDALAGIERVSIRMAGDDCSVSLSSPERTVALILTAAKEAETSRFDGFLRITPAVGNDEPPLSAAFACTMSRKIWEDEDYNTHEDYAWTLEVKPDMSLVSPDDVFHSTYIEFAPLTFSAQAEFTKREKVSSPVQLVIELGATLPDAEVALTANLKMAERWAHDPLPLEGGEDITSMTPERKEELRRIFVENAVQTMMNLNAVPAQ